MDTQPRLDIQDNSQPNFYQVQTHFSLMVTGTRIFPLFVFRKPTPKYGQNGLLNANT